MKHSILFSVASALGLLQLISLSFVSISIANSITPRKQIIPTATATMFVAPKSTMTSVINTATVVVPSNTATVQPTKTYYPTLTLWSTATPIATKRIVSTQTPFTQQKLKPTKTLRPTETEKPSYPSGLTAICKDGTYSYSKHASGTCSGHGGVKQWINKP